MKKGSESSPSKSNSTTTTRNKEEWTELFSRLKATVEQQQPQPQPRPSVGKYKIPQRANAQQQQQQQSPQKGRSWTPQIQPPIISIPSPLLPILEDMQDILSRYGGLPIGVTKEEIPTIISTLCESAPLPNSPVYSQVLISKILEIINAIMKKQVVSFRQVMMEPILNFFLEVINGLGGVRSTISVGDSMVRLDCLRVLSVVLYENGSQSGTKVQPLLDVLLSLASLSNKDLESRRIATNCLGNLCFRSGAKLSKYYSSIFDLLFTNFSQYVVDISKDLSSVKMLCSCVHSLQLLIGDSRTAHEVKAPVLINELKKLTFFGTSFYPSPIVSPRGFSNSTSTTSSDSEFSDSEDRQGVWKVRFHGLTCLQAIARVSPKTFYHYWSIFIPSTRIHDPSSLVARSFSPSTQTPYSNTQSIFSVIIYDPSQKVRIAACGLLTTIIDSSRAYMVALSVPTHSHHSPTPVNNNNNVNVSSSNSNPPSNISQSSRIKSTRTSYTPFSQTLASVVYEMHMGLLWALDHELNPSCLTQLIKCVSVLVSNTYYEALQPGLLLSIMYRLHHFLYIGYLTSPTVSKQPSDSSLKRDSSETSLSSNINNNNNTSSENLVTTTTLSCLLALLIPKSPLPEVTQYLESGVGDGTNLIGPKINLPPPPDLVDIIIALSVPTSPTRADALQVLGGLTKHHYNIFSNLWCEKCLSENDFSNEFRGTSSLFSLIESGFNDSDGAVRMHASKLLEDTTKAALESERGVIGGSDDDENVMSSTFPRAFKTKKEPLSIVKHTPHTPLTLSGLWTQIFHSPIIIPRSVDDALPQIRTSLCTTLSHVPPEIFSETERNSKDPIGKNSWILCVTTIMSLLTDSASNVRAAAARTVGVYVLNSSLKSDPVFISDASRGLISCLEDSSIPVRVRACWALANLCEGLGEMRMTQSDNLLSDSLSLKLEKELLVPSIVFIELGESLIRSAINGNDKIRSNAVRGIGNYIRYLPLSVLNTKASKESNVGNNKVQQETLQERNDKEETILFKMINSLLANINLEPSKQEGKDEPNNKGQAAESTSVKVKWNACYAMGNVFKNQELFNQFEQPLNWTPTIINSLTKIILDCKNFKTKINAAASLSLLPSRAHYGFIPSREVQSSSSRPFNTQDLRTTPNINNNENTPFHAFTEILTNNPTMSYPFSKLFISLCDSFNTIDDIDDFSEFKYKETLKRQVVQTLAHLIILATDIDMSLILSILPLPFKETLHALFNELSSTQTQAQTDTPSNQKLEESKESKESKENTDKILLALHKLSNYG